MVRVKMHNAANGQHMPPLTRRTFLRNTLAGGASMAWLAGCATATPIKRAPVNLKWICEYGHKNDILTFSTLVDLYNKTNPDNIHVDVEPGTAHDLLKNILTQRDRASRAHYDIFSLDVVWMSEFASQGWIVSLDQYWSKDDQARYLLKPRQAASYQGKIWGAPLHTDVGVLYYRKDFFNPTKDGQLKTWDDLQSQASRIMLNRHLRSGFTWQGLPFKLPGQPFEGMICNFVEFLSGYGGKVFDDSYTRILVNRPEAQRGFQKMVEFANTISLGAKTYQEGQSTNEWKHGQAAFMRNWPLAIIDSIDHASSQVADYFDVMSLPSQVKPCLGGWQLTINSSSDSDKQQAAWQFIQWMLQRDAQHFLAVKEDFPVTLKAIYADTEINNWNPYYHRLQGYIDNAQFRPAIPRYQEVTQAIASNVNAAFTGQLTPEVALQTLETQLNRILANKK
jgi:multiple sugar transport system substrate-binding protein